MASPPALSRALGFSEENWFKSTASGTGIVVLGAALKREVDTSLVKDAARHVAEQHAIIKAKIVVNAKGKPFLEVSASALPVVKEKSWPSLTDDSDLAGLIRFGGDYEDHSLSIALYKIVREEMNLPFVNAGGNQAITDVFQINVYKDSKRPQTVIVLRIHGGAIDRHGGCIVAQDFLTALNSLVEGKEPQSPDNPGKESLLPSMEDLVPKGKSSKGFLQKGVDVVGYAWNSKKYALLAFNPDFTTLRDNPLQSDLVSFSLGRHGTASFTAACKHESTSPAAALAAAFLMASADVKEMKDKKLDEFSFTSVLNCRDYFEPPLPNRVVGNYSAGILQGEKIKGDISFWDLARHISASTEKSVAKSKHFSEIPVLGMLFSQILKHPSLTPSSSLRSSLFSMFSDGLLNSQWENVEALHLVGTIGPVSSMHFVGPCFSVGESLIEGPELQLSLIFATPVYTRQQMNSLLTSAVELLSSSTKGY